MMTNTSTDPLADAVRTAWDAHAAAIKSNDDVAIRRAFLAVLRAERALEVDSLAVCTQAATRPHYEAAIADYDARIADEVAALA